MYFAICMQIAKETQTLQMKKLKLNFNYKNGEQIKYLHSEI